jgi:CRISPR/Cas system endoribonuclease Cas6 (RAMP superfamily)
MGFVHEIYKLLESKYGKKRPVFKGLNPLEIFSKLDSYLKLERWNLRYHPYDFYQRIVTSAYARWDFPKSRIIFSINISAPDKRFDYILSAASLEMKRAIDDEIEQLRSSGL